MGAYPTRCTPQGVSRLASPQGLSQRQSAKRLEVPRTTLQAWRASQDRLDACPQVVEFLEGVPGLAFFHRIPKMRARSGSSRAAKRAILRQLYNFRCGYFETYMELEGQVAIVTGAGRGIGRATALELARLGADIVVAQLDRANAARTAAEVQTLGRPPSVVPTDVTSRADLAVMVERTRAAFGRIDVLVNNAGIYRAAFFLKITEEHWDAVMNINAKAVFFASQAVLPTMIAQKRGAIYQPRVDGGKGREPH